MEIVPEGIDPTSTAFFTRDDYFDVLRTLRDEAPVHRCRPRPPHGRPLRRHPRDQPRPGAVRVEPRGAGQRPDAHDGHPGGDRGRRRSSSWTRPSTPRTGGSLNREFTPRSVGTAGGADPRAGHGRRSTGLPAGEPIDVVDHLTAPFPLLVIAELLGIPDGDRGDFRRWSDATIESTDRPPEETLGAVMELHALPHEHLEAKQRATRATTSCRCSVARRDRRPAALDRRALHRGCSRCSSPATRPPARCCRAGIVALAEHPDQRAALAADPTGIPGAVEECLRWVTPIQTFCRTVVADTTVGGAPVAAGDYLVMLYASGNRDERARSGPTADRFDVTRPGQPRAPGVRVRRAPLPRRRARPPRGAGVPRGAARAVTRTTRSSARPSASPSTLVAGIHTLPVALAGLSEPGHGRHRRRSWSRARADDDGTGLLLRGPLLDLARGRRRVPAPRRAAARAARPRSVPRRRAAREHARVPVPARRRRARGRHGRRHQPDAPRRGARPRRAPHRLPARRHRVRPGRRCSTGSTSGSPPTDCWSSTATDYRARLDALRRPTGRRSGRAAAGPTPETLLTPDLHVGLDGRAEGGAHDPGARRARGGALGVRAPTTSSTARCRCSTATRSRRACSRRSRPARRCCCAGGSRPRGSCPTSATTARPSSAPSAARSRTSSRRRRPTHDRDHHLKYVLAPESSAPDIAAFSDRFGVPVIEGYGSSENAVILMPVPGTPPGSLGKPHAGQRRRGRRPGHRRGVRRARSSTPTAGCSTPATRSARSSAATRRRRSRATTTTPRPTRSATRNGWYWSGDLAYRDADGFFWFAGPQRRLDPRRRRELHARHRSSASSGAPDGIAGVAVYAVPDARTADQVMARSSSSPAPTFDPEAFAAFLAAPARPRDQVGAALRARRRSTCRSRARTRSTRSRCGPSAGRRPTPSGGGRARDGRVPAR